MGLKPNNVGPQSPSGTFRLGRIERQLGRQAIIAGGDVVPGEVTDFGQTLVLSDDLKSRIGIPLRKDETEDVAAITTDQLNQFVISYDPSTSKFTIIVWCWTSEDFRLLDDHDRFYQRKLTWTFDVPNGETWLHVYHVPCYKINNFSAIVWTAPTGSINASDNDTELCEMPASGPGYTYTDTRIGVIGLYADGTFEYYYEYAEVLNCPLPMPRVPYGYNKHTKLKYYYGGGGGVDKHIFYNSLSYPIPAGTANGWIYIYGYINNSLFSLSLTEPDYLTFWSFKLASISTDASGKLLYLAPMNQSYMTEDVVAMSNIVSTYHRAIR